MTNTEGAYCNENPNCVTVGTHKRSECRYVGAVHNIEHVTGDMFVCKACGYNMPSARVGEDCEYVGVKVTAKMKRFRGIGMVSRWLSYTNDAYLMEDREAIELEIVDLRMLGRTDRWIAACDRWLWMVQDADAESIRWALGQGSIYAVHAA